MAALCAVCQFAIVLPQRFVVSGTEAIHRACAQSGRTTVLQRAQLAVSDAQARCATEQRQNVQLNARIAALERQAHQATMDHLAEKRRLLQSAARAEAMFLSVKDELEAALRARPAPPPPTTPDVLVVDPPRTPDGDDTEIRMSLLEGIPE